MIGSDSNESANIKTQIIHNTGLNDKSSQKHADIRLKNDKLSNKFEDSKSIDDDHCQQHKHNHNGVGKNSSRSNSGKTKVSADRNREEPRSVSQDEQGNNQQIECQICAFPFDRQLKVPRILQCGHTFCQTCLGELKEKRG